MLSIGPTKLRSACSLEDVEAKLVDTEKEADQARKQSKSARDHFNDIKRQRYAYTFNTDSLFSLMFTEPKCSMMLTTTYLTALTKSIRT
jgi:hypothetical protein